MDQNSDELCAINLFQQKKLVIGLYLSCAPEENWSLDDSSQRRRRQLYSIVGIFEID
jgi:hypothetical protein